MKSSRRQGRRSEGGDANNDLVRMFILGTWLVCRVGACPLQKRLKRHCHWLWDVGLSSCDGNGGLDGRELARRGIALRDMKRDCRLLIYAGVPTIYGPRASNGQSERASQIIDLYLKEGNTNQGNLNASIDTPFMSPTMYAI